MRSKGWLWMLCIWLIIPLFAQENPFNMRMVGRWNQTSVYFADVWGDGNYAYCGHYIRDGRFPAQVDIIDVSNPSFPTRVANYLIPPPGNFSGPEDVQANNDLLFTGNETQASGSDGMFVSDIRNPALPRLIANVNISNFRRVHTFSYDPASRFLYLANSRTNEVAVVDLRSLTPDSQYTTITTPKWRITNVGSSFVHEVYARNGRLYCSAWDSGVWVYDVSDVANSAPRFIGSAPGSSTHSAVASEDGQWVVTAEERWGGGIKLYEVQSSGQNITLTLRDQYAISTTRAISVHQVFIKGDRVYCSWYQAGVLIFELDRVNKRLLLVGSFDTTARSGAYEYNGCWACYPYLGDDRILASDIETGLWVLELLVPTIKGSFTLNDFAGSYSGLTPTLEFRRPGTTEVVATYQATLDASGQYMVKDVKRGTYDVAVKFSTWLRQVVRNVNFDYGQETTVNFSLTNGDVNGDNLINDQDLTRVLLAFGYSGDRPEDLDRNGTVDDGDVRIVLSNFGRQGDT